MGVCTQILFRKKLSEYSKIFVQNIKHQYMYFLNDTII